MRRGSIALVGIGCRFPGGVVDPSSFWQLLLKGKDPIGEAPRQRRFAHHLRGGFIDDIDSFDADFFGYRPGAVSTMDPRLPLLLSVGWEALDEAGVGEEKRRRAGVFIGLLSKPVDDADLPGLTGGGNAVAAQVSRLLGLTGPALMVDTDRSSSLVAVSSAPMPPAWLWVWNVTWSS